MTWLHMLFDGAGSESFLRWLDAVYRGERRVDELPPDDATVAPGMPVGLGARERGQRATAWQRAMGELGEPPPHSLAGPLRREPQRLRSRAHTLDEDRTAQAIAEAGRRAGFLTPMLHYLAAAIRAHQAVHRSRGHDPGAFVVPLPVNVRPKGAEEAIFRTRVSLLWFQVPVEIVDDIDALLSHLKEQRRRSIKAGRVEGGVIAMDYARWAPMRLYAHMARRALRGELCSFFFAYTGEFAEGLEQFFGARVENAFHAPAVPPSPGSGTAVSLFRGRMNVSQVAQAGVFTPAESALWLEQFESDLLGSGG